MSREANVAYRNVHKLAVEHVRTAPLPSIFEDGPLFIGEPDVNASIEEATFAVVAIYDALILLRKGREALHQAGVEERNEVLEGLKENATTLLHPANLHDAHKAEFFTYLRNPRDPVELLARRADNKKYLYWSFEAVQLLGEVGEDRGCPFHTPSLDLNRKPTSAERFLRAICDEAANGEVVHRDASTLDN